jgi:PAS domain S-box-containing protein
MGPYAILPLLGFFANIVLGFYILYINPKERLNRLYSLVTFSLAIWSAGNFLFFMSTTPEGALAWDRLGTIGSSLTAAFLLHFFLVFTKQAFRRGYILFLYLPILFFTFIDSTTSLIVESTRLAPWGYAIVPGILYIPYTISVALYTVIGILFCYRFYLKTESPKEKMQAKLIIIAVSAPLVVGITTEIVPEVMGFEIVPLASTLSTLTAIIVAYAIVKYGLMTITPEMAAENIIETMTDYLIVVDDKRNVALVNRSCLEVLGRRKEELIGRRLDAVFPEERSLFKEIGKDAHLRNYETRILTKDKKLLPISLNSSKIADKFGGVAGFILMMRDTRKARELIGRLEERTGELDVKINELTKTKSAILNMMEDMEEANREMVKTKEELERSLKELKEMDVKKDQFISIAAHELKTPLTSIHGFSQLLQNRKVSNNFTKRNKYLKIMDHETKRLAKLVNDILDLSRIDLGTVKFSLDEVNINRLIEDVKKEMNVQMNEKGLESEYDIEKGIPRIVTDREKLTEILINLIGNAVKYTPKGKITVRAFREGSGVRFIIKDTGIGIAKEEQKRIFERFYQVDSSYSRKAGGTGLGLALCNEFVDLLGGRLWVEGEVGKGSEFNFTLPIGGPPEGETRGDVRTARERLEKSKIIRKGSESKGYKETVKEIVN